MGHCRDNLASQSLEWYSQTKSWYNVTNQRISYNAFNSVFCGFLDGGFPPTLGNPQSLAAMSTNCNLLYPVFRIC